MKKYMKIGIALVFIAIVMTVPVSAEQTFMRGRGTLYAEGDGLTHLNIGHGAAKLEVTDSTILIHDYGRRNTRIWAEGEGTLTKYGRTWVYTGSGTVYAKGYGFYISAHSTTDRMLALGRGFAFFDGTFDYFTLNWDKAEITDDLKAKVDQMGTLVKDIESGDVELSTLDNQIAEIASI